MIILPAQPKLLDQVRGEIRVKYYSNRTEQSYVDWIKLFVFHFDKRHPRDLRAAEVEAFLTHLAVAGRVAASMQHRFFVPGEAHGYYLVGHALPGGKLDKAPGLVIKNIQ